MSIAGEKRVIALRIVTRMRDIPRHESALDLAIAAFGERFDAARFVDAATSTDPAQLLRAYGIQSGFEKLQNHLAGLTRTRSSWWASCRRPIRRTPHAICAGSNGWAPSFERVATLSSRSRSCETAFNLPTPSPLQSLHVSDKDIRKRGPWR